MRKTDPEYRQLSRVFGMCLRAIRTDRGMSQEEFGQVLGISKQVLSRYERGNRCPPLATAWFFSQRLGIPLDVMVGELPPMSRSARENVPL